MPHIANPAANAGAPAMGGNMGKFARWLKAERGWQLQVVRHPERQLWRDGLEEKPKDTCHVPPRRWVVERSFAWLGQSPPLSKDYERLPETGEAGHESPHAPSPRQAA